MASGHKAPEKKLTSAPIVEFMRRLGWHCECLEVGVTWGGAPVGTPGRSDWLFCKSIDKNGVAAMIFLECKAPGARMRCNCRDAEYGFNARGRSVIRKRAHKCRMCSQTEFRESMIKKGFVAVQFDNPRDYKDWFLRMFSWTIQTELDLKTQSSLDWLAG